MGFPTPFPEPDSPELQRFAVRSPGDIVRRLRALQEAAVPLSAFVGAGAPLDVVTLLRVQEEAPGELALAGVADEALRGRLLGVPLATFVGFDDAGKVQFIGTPAPACSGDDGGREFTLPMPEQLFCLQRRSAARTRLASAKPAVCRIPLPGRAGEWEALRVIDISTSGIAVLTYPKRFEPVVGAEIDGCRLDLPGVGGAVVSVRVRNRRSQLERQQARGCGCEFVRMTPAVASMLTRFAASAPGIR